MINSGDTSNWRRECRIDIEDDANSRVKQETGEEVFENNYFCTTEEFDGENAAYEYIGQYFAMTDLTLESPNDPDYVPVKEIGRAHV